MSYTSHFPVFSKGLHMSGGFTISASVCPTDHATILLAIAARLRHDIPDLFGSETTCFISDTAWPGVEVMDETFCTVHPADSDFDPKLPIGAGNLGIVENGIFHVTVWSRLMTDQIEHSVLALTDATRGALKLKQRVLASLAGQQIYADIPTNSVPLLLTWLRPLKAMHPHSRQGDGDFTSFSIAFLGPFIWNLTG